MLCYCYGIKGFFSNIFLEAATRGVLWKGVFFGVLRDSLESACSGASLAGLRPAALLQGETLVRVFFLWVLRDIWRHLFYIAPPENCFCLLLKGIEN